MLDDFTPILHTLPKATCDPQCLVLEFKNSNDVRGSIRVAW